MLRNRTALLAVLLTWGCAGPPPKKVTVRTVDTGRDEPQPLAMKQFLHIADDGDLLVVGGPLGQSRSLTSKALFAELERLAPRGLALLYSLESSPDRASAAARHTLARLEQLEFPKRRVDPPPGASSPYGGGATILMAKSQAGDREWVEDLLVRGVAVDSLDDDGKSALIYAAGAGRTAVIERLIRAGAVVDRADADGSTALMFAAQAGHTDAARALIAAGAWVALRGAHGLTALDFATRGGHAAAAAALRSAR